MQVKRVGGAGLFHAECITMEQLLKRVYPDFPWDPSRFVAVNNTPRGYWMKESNLLRALELAEQKMGIKSVSVGTRLNVGCAHIPFLARRLVLRGAHGLARDRISCALFENEACRPAAREVSQSRLGRDISHEGKACKTEATGTSDRCDVSGESCLTLLLRTSHT